MIKFYSMLFVLLASSVVTAGTGSLTDSVANGDKALSIQSINEDQVLICDETGNGIIIQKEDVVEYLSQHEDF